MSEARDSQSVGPWEPSSDEKELVRRSWSDDFNFLYELGAAIYTYIFEHAPQAKELFPSIHRHGEGWRHSAEFRLQALRFVQALSHSVKNVYRIGDTASHFHNVGQRHVKFDARGFKPAYWDIFQDAIESSLTEHINSIRDFTAEQKLEAIAAWRRLALFIITHMKRGYSQGMAETKNV